MGLFSFIFGLLSAENNSRTDEFAENNSWFKHSGEEHDVEDGYCIECDDDEENLMN